MREGVVLYATRREIRPVDDPAAKHHSTGVWARFCRNRGAGIGLIVLSAFVVVALVAPLATSYDPEQTRLEEKLREPSAAHVLGTDTLGRDILARLAYGDRFSLLIGVHA